MNDTHLSTFQDKTLRSNIFTHLFYPFSTIDNKYVRRRRPSMAGKATFDKLGLASRNLASPVNKFTNKIGSEHLPTTLDHESDKQLGLKSFCIRVPFLMSIGLTERSRGWLLQGRTRLTRCQGPKNNQNSCENTSEVIQNCVGLAILPLSRLILVLAPEVRSFDPRKETARGPLRLAS